MADRIPSTEQSFYKISVDLDGISGSVEGLEEAIATLGEGIEALDETVEVIEAALETVVTAVEAQGEILQQILEATTGPEAIELQTGSMLLPSNNEYMALSFDGVTTDPDGWINVYEYETVSMVASVQANDYTTFADTPPLTFDHTVSTFEQFKETVVNAADGATIYVEPGTYMLDEQIVLNRPIAIYGAGNATIFQAGENTSSVLDFDVLFAIKSSNVKLQGFKLLVNSVATSANHRCFLLAGDYTTQSLLTGGTVTVGGVPTPASQVRALWSGPVENIELVNIEIEAVKQISVMAAGLADNVRVQGCTFNLVANNSTANSGSSSGFALYGIGGEWLVQDCFFTMTPLFPANPYVWARPFFSNTANYWAGVNSLPGYDVVHSSAKLTIRNVSFNHKMRALIQLAPEANDTYPLDPLNAMEICIDNCTCYVESNNPTVIVSAQDRDFGTLVSVRGLYYNPGGSNGPYMRTPYLLDCVNDISISNCNITGGERGFVFARYIVEAAFPNYTPVETPPLQLRSISPISLHFFNNTFNRVNPQKTVEGASGPAPWNNVYDPFFGTDFEGLFLYPQLYTYSGFSSVDDVPSEGVQPPADITRPGQGTFEVKTEYRLVNDGIALEFVPGTTIDVLTEPQKEVINPRIPAVLVGVLDIRFLVRARDMLGDNFLSLFGTIR